MVRHNANKVYDSAMESRNIGVALEVEFGEVSTFTGHFGALVQGTSPVCGGYLHLLQIACGADTLRGVWNPHAV